MTESTHLRSDPAPLRSSRSQLALLLVLVAATLVASAYFVRFVSASGNALERERILSLVRTAAATLESSRIAALTGTATDIGSADFDAVRGELKRVRDVNPDFRFVYLMRPDATVLDRFVFLADAEAPESDDYSAPGDVYDGPSETLMQVFLSGVPDVERPNRDRWGYWVSPIAPVRDADGKIVAILGMDVRADAWLATEGRYRAFALTI